MRIRIRTMEQVDELESIIGSKRVEQTKQLLSEGGLAWIFHSTEEAEAEPELSTNEKIWCCKNFTPDKEWVMWHQRPHKPIYIPGYSVSPNYDTHGNSINPNATGINYKDSH